MNGTLEERSIGAGNFADAVGPATNRRSFLRTLAGGSAAAAVNPRGLSASPSRVAAAPLRATLDDATWKHRLLAFHRVVFDSEEFEFEGLMTSMYRPPEGYVLADYCIVRDNGLWHLFYATGELRNADEWLAAIHVGDWKRARQIPYETHDGHAAGPRLNQLEFKGTILDTPQGDLGIGGQDASRIIRVGDEWVDVYTVLGTGGEALCLARSQDLDHWRMESTNPVWKPPAYADPHGVCKQAFILHSPTDPYYLIYYSLCLAEGPVAIGLLTTRDFKVFEDHGPVIEMTVQLRGVSRCETPCVIFREGVWYLFFTYGPGVMHAVSNRPDSFMVAPTGTGTVSTGGVYSYGAFHSGMMYEHEGQWFFTSTRKEWQRRIDRKSGAHKFRSTAADEASLLAGLFICGVEWKSDQPVLRRMEEHEIP